MFRLTDMIKLDIGCYLILNMGRLDLSTVTLKMDYRTGGQCYVSPPDLSTVSLRLMDLITVTDCDEDSLYQYFILLNLIQKYFCVII